MLELAKFKQELDSYTAFLIFSGSEQDDGVWIGRLNKALEYAQAVEDVLRSHGFKDSVIVAEVVPRIVSSWRVKWKEARSGTRRPSSIRRVERIDGSTRAIFIMVPKNWKNLAEKVLSEIEYFED